MFVISPQTGSLTGSSVGPLINRLGKLLLRVMNSMSRSYLLFFCYQIHFWTKVYVVQNAIMMNKPYHKSMDGGGGRGIKCRQGKPTSRKHVYFSKDKAVLPL